MYVRLDGERHYLLVSLEMLDRIQACALAGALKDIQSPETTPALSWLCA